MTAIFGVIAAICGYGMSPMSLFVSYVEICTYDGIFFYNFLVFVKALLGFNSWLQSNLDCVHFR